MAQKLANVPMNIGSGKTVFVNLNNKIVDYFGLEAAVAAGTTVSVDRQRRDHDRRTFDGLTGTVKATKRVPLAKWKDVGGRERKGRASGKLIKLPTELPYNAARPQDGYRLTSIRVPGAATNYAIAMWINTTFTKHKPSYFLTPSGQSYPVAVPTVADPNPGNNTPAPTPATP